MHGPGERLPPRPDEEVGVTREERPGVDGEPHLSDERRQPSHEIRAVGVVTKDRAPLNSSNHHGVEDAGGVQTRLAGHGRGRVVRGVIGCSVPSDRYRLRYCLADVCVFTEDRVGRGLFGVAAPVEDVGQHPAKQ